MSMVVEAVLVAMESSSWMTVVAFLAVVSWTGLLLVVGVVLGPEYPGIANNIAICMALLQVIGIVFFGFKVVGRKKGVV